MWAEDSRQYYSSNISAVDVILLFYCTCWLLCSLAVDTEFRIGDKRLHVAEWNGNCTCLFRITCAISSGRMRASTVGIVNCQSEYCGQLCCRCQAANSRQIIICYIILINSQWGIMLKPRTCSTSSLTSLFACIQYPHERRIFHNIFFLRTE